jgi:superfamily I DNA and/or RNA helicase
VIAKYLKEWIDSEEGKFLSFGIISFYKAQVYAVYESLAKYKITKRAPDGSWQISERYRSFEKDKNGKEITGERLRIGTVDAFQGMEFDVVFLSMVRSQNVNNFPLFIKNESDYSKKQQRIFGHLMSENRLCVSMSRQKKVLAVVGDGDLVQTQIAMDAVPALKNYYDLCKERGVIL